MKVKGVFLCLLVALIATYLGYIFPLVGSMIFSIIIGIIIGNLINTAPYEEGIKYSGKKLLQYGIILMGFTLSFKAALSLGASSFPLIITSIAAALSVGVLVGKLFGVNQRLSTLIGVGTAICGGSAIAAVSPIIKAKDEEIAFSIATIFLLTLLQYLSFRQSVTGYNLVIQALDILPVQR